MDWCYGGGDRVFTEESGMAASWASYEQESHRVQMGRQEETSSIRKRREKIRIKRGVEVNKLEKRETRRIK